MSRRSIGSLIILFGLLWGCASVPSPRYYMVRLDLSDLDDRPLQPPQKSLRVARFHASAPLRQDSIVSFQDDSARVEFSPNDIWESSPPDIVSRKLADAFRGSRLFTRVDVQPGRSPTDYLIRGRILRFNRLDTSDGTYGEVGLEVAFVDHKRHATLWSAVIRVQEKVKGDGTEAVVLALSEALKQSILQIIHQVRQANASQQLIR